MPRSATRPARSDPDRVDPRRDRRGWGAGDSAGPFREQADLRAAGPPPRAAHSFAVSRREACGFWPTSRHEGLLRAALLGPPALNSGLEQWLEGTDLARLDYPSLTLAPLLYRNLLRHGAAAQLRQRFHGTYRWCWHRNQLLVAALQDALGALRAAGVETMLMKGVPLALCHYRDVGARVIGDADVVVRRADVWRALDALVGAGWKAEQPVTPRVLTSLSGVNLRNERGLVLDLNWHILPDHYEPALDEALWQQAVTISVGAEPARCLHPTDHLLEVICHGLSWAANSPLHWVADATVLLRAEQDSLDWGRLIDQATRHRRVRTVRAALRYLATVYEAPVPAAVLAQLDLLPVGIEERMAYWFAGRSGPTWPWGRGPLLLASYLRSTRSRRRRPGGVDLLRFLGARAALTPAECLKGAGRDILRHLTRFPALAASRLLGVPERVRR